MRRKPILNRPIWKNKSKWQCPRCYSTRLGLDGFALGTQRFRCKKCGTVTTKPRGKSR